MAMPQITKVRVGIPGMPGSGVSAAAWAALQAVVASDTSGNINTGGTLTVAGTSTLNGDNNIGNASTDTNTVTGHIETGGSPPTIVANAAAGSGATAAVVLGNDTAGLIRVTAGTGPTTGNICTITNFVVRADANYIVILTPADDNAAALTKQPFVNKDAVLTTAWVVKAPVALAASTAHFWWFHILG